jgi:peroxiredoxin
MLETCDQAPSFSLARIDGEPFSVLTGPQKRPRLLVFFETDCPTCRLAIPYINRLSRAVGDEADILGISQDPEQPTRELIEEAPIEFAVALDSDLSVTRLYDPVAVPTLFLIGNDGRIIQTLGGFDKRALNEIATAMAGKPLVIAEPFDGAPETKYGCVSRHLEGDASGEIAAAANPYAKRAARASRNELDDAVDPRDYCMQFGDP